MQVRMHNLCSEKRNYWVVTWRDGESGTLDGIDYRNGSFAWCARVHARRCGPDAGMVANPIAPADLARK